MKVDLSRLTLCGSSVGLAQPSMCGSHNRFPGSMGVGVNGQIYPSSRGYTIPVSAKGSIQFSGQEPTFSSSQTSFGAAVRTDFINQAFWALWYGGGLDQADLRALVPSIPEGIELSVRANLPPVLMPGTGGHSFHLGLGDLDIDATVDINRFLNETQGGNPVWVNINLNLSLLVGAGISLNRSTNELSLVAGNSPELYFTIYSIDDRTYGPLIGERLGKLLSKTYAELLAGAVRSIDIPEFDMSGTASLPQGTVFKLTRGILGHNEGHVTVSGTVGLAN